MTHPDPRATASISQEPSGYRVGKKIRDRSKSAMSRIMVAKIATTNAILFAVILSYP